jgi:T-complex protein 1 subunit zeta
MPLSDFSETNKTQRRAEALRVNISAGEGLQDVLKSNLGPSGTLKMYAPKSTISQFQYRANYNQVGGWCWWCKQCPTLLMDHDV